MNRHQLTSIAVAMACFLAVGVAATTLSSTLSSDPDEAVDLNYEYLPIESSDVSALQQEIEKKDPDAPQERDGQRGGTGEDGSGGSPENAQPRDMENRGLNPSSGDRDDPGNMPGEDENGAGPAPGNGSGAIGGGDGGGGDQAQSETDSNADGTLPLVGVLLAGVLVALAYRYRDRLLALFGSPDSTEPEREAADRWEPTPPSDGNAVFAAWSALVRTLEDEDTRVRTTSECATAAANAGMDADAIATLARTFEEVRYGERPVTEDRRERVSRVCRRLQLDPAGVNG